MSQQVERLQQLLERVQRNRGERRVVTLAPAANVQAMSKPAAKARAAEPVASAPPGAARGKPAPTPLEMALEGRTSRARDAREDAREETMPISFAPTPVQPSRAPAAVAAPVHDGRVLVDASAVEPSKPIVQVVSKQPPIAASSFGELLRRSLSLRPR